MTYEEKIPGKLYQIKRGGYKIYKTVNDSIINSTFTTGKLTQSNSLLRPFIAGIDTNILLENHYVMFIAKTKFKTTKTFGDPTEEFIYQVLYKNIMGYVHENCFKAFDWSFYDNFIKNITNSCNTIPQNVTVQVQLPVERISLNIKITQH